MVDVDSVGSHSEHRQTVALGSGVLLISGYSGKPPGQGQCHCTMLDPFKAMG
jgi:hypothetical protein